MSAVRAPVPMSVASIPTTKPPFSRCAQARAGRRRAGYVDAATPVPTSQRPSRRTPGRGSRASQPKRAAPSRRQATRFRLENGLPLSGSTSGSLRTRSSIGSSPVAIASSSIAHSSANIPGHSPGARIHEGDGTSSRATRCVVRRFSPAYSIRVTTAVCSAKSRSVEVCSTTSWQIAVSRPSSSAPSRIRWIVGVR